MTVSAHMRIAAPFLFHFHCVIRQFGKSLQSSLSKDSRRRLSGAVVDDVAAATVPRHFSHISRRKWSVGQSWRQAQTPSPSPMRLRHAKCALVRM